MNSLKGGKGRVADHLLSFCLSPVFVFPSALAPSDVVVDLGLGRGGPVFPLSSFISAMVKDVYRRGFSSTDLAMDLKKQSKSRESN